MSCSFSRFRSLRERIARRRAPTQARRAVVGACLQATTEAIAPGMTVSPTSCRLNFPWCSQVARQARPLEHGQRMAEMPEGLRAGSAPVRRRPTNGLSANPGGRERTRGTWACEGRVRGATFSLLRASCPSPFGPPSAFSRVPDARVGTFPLATQEKVIRAPGGAREKTGMSWSMDDRTEMVSS